MRYPFHKERAERAGPKKLGRSKENQAEQKGAYCMYDTLFSPFRVRGMELKNRILCV